MGHNDCPVLLLHGCLLFHFIPTLIPSFILSSSQSYFPSFIFFLNTFFINFSSHSLIHRQFPSFIHAFCPFTHHVTHHQLIQPPTQHPTWLTTLPPIALQVSAWGGYVFIINLIPLHVFVLLLMGRYSSKILVGELLLWLLLLLVSCGCGCFW